MNNQSRENISEEFISFVMKGYLGNAAATVATITSDGWLKTVDVCYFDEDGFLYIVDPIKELIKYNG